MYKPGPVATTQKLSCPAYLPATAKGKAIRGDIPPLDGLVWWDADPLRELQTRGRVSKWQGPVLTSDIEGNVMAWADIIGDWREEIITYTPNELRIYTTIIPAVDRRVCLMQDPLYRDRRGSKSDGVRPSTDDQLLSRQQLIAPVVCALPFGDGIGSTLVRLTRSFSLIFLL